MKRSPATSSLTEKHCVRRKIEILAVTLNVFSLLLFTKRQLNLPLKVQLGLMWSVAIFPCLFRCFKANNRLIADLLQIIANVLLTTIFKAHNATDQPKMCPFVQLIIRDYSQQNKSPWECPSSPQSVYKLQSTFFYKLYLTVEIGRMKKKNPCG